MRDGGRKGGREGEGGELLSEGVGGWVNKLPSE